MPDRKNPRITYKYYQSYFQIGSKLAQKMISADYRLVKKQKLRVQFITLNWFNKTYSEII